MVCVMEIDIRYFCIYLSFGLEFLIECFVLFSNIDLIKLGQDIDGVCFFHILDHHRHFICLDESHHFVLSVL